LFPSDFFVFNIPLARIAYMNLNTPWFSEPFGLARDIFDDVLPESRRKTGKSTASPKDSPATRANPFSLSDPQLQLTCGSFNR
jgi:hypothetical protein